MRTATTEMARPLTEAARCARSCAPLASAQSTLALISYLPVAVLGLMLSWLDLPDAAVAGRTCKAWLAAVQSGRSQSGAICLVPHGVSEADHDRQMRSKGVRPWRDSLERILSSVWRRHIGDLCFPWSAVWTEPAELEWLSRVASSMPQLERLSLTIAMELLPMDRLELPAQLRELCLQIRLDSQQGRDYDIRRGVEPSVACVALQQRVAATLRLVLEAAPPLRALTVRIGRERTYYTLWRGACAVLLQFKQLGRLCVYIELRSVPLDGPEAAMITLLGSQMPRLRTLIVTSAEWGFQESWRSCPRGPCGGTPMWTADALALLTAGPRNQCVLEFIGKFAAAVTQRQYDELRRAIPTLKQPLRR